MEKKTHLVSYTRGWQGLPRNLEVCLTESQLVRIVLSKIDKSLIDLTLSMIITDYDSWTTLADAFATMKQCDHALYNTMLLTWCPC